MMVERENWGKLREDLEQFSSDVLSELCYILDLRRSGNINKKVQRILACDHDYEYVKNRINFLIFGLIMLDYYTADELIDLLEEYELPKQRRNWDRMIEIIKSEIVIPRSLIGKLTSEELKDLYITIFEEDTDLDNKGIIRTLIDHFNLTWLEEIMDNGFILMAMTNDPDLEKTYKLIKEECNNYDINTERIDEIQSSGLITKEILEKIEEAKYLFVDLTFERPNVYYELGYGHGFGMKPENIVLMARKGTRLHFDIRNMRTIMYEDHKHLKKEMKKRLKGIVRK